MMDRLRRWTGRRDNGSAKPIQRSQEDDELTEMMTRPVASLQQQINRVFDTFFEDFPMSLGTESLRSMTPLRQFEPRMDLSETADAFKITVDVPGMTDDDIELTVSDDSLMISGERSEESEEEDENIFRRERSYGMFRRRVPLPEGIDRDEISATFKQGVLKIEVPKTEEARKNWRKIEVKSET